MERAIKEIKWLIKNADKNAESASMKIEAYLNDIELMKKEYTKQQELKQQLEEVLRRLEGE